jgi:tRNA(fMet)-specific endonuclease VapC
MTHPIYLLDTDITSTLFRGNSPEPLREKINLIPSDQIWVSAITVAEMQEGAFALIRKEEMRHVGTQGYRLLTEQVQFFADFPVLPFDDDCLALFSAFPPSVRRQGRADCQIAAIALRFGAIIVTRNLRHFTQIPGCRIEDWCEAIPQSPSNENA